MIKRLLKTNSKKRKRNPVLKEFLPSSERSHFRRLFAKFPLTDTWFWQDLIFATLSNGRQLGWKSLANLGDKCQESTGQGCQDAVWARLRAKTPLRGSRGRDQIPYPEGPSLSPDARFRRTWPESRVPDLSTARQPGAPRPHSPDAFHRLNVEAQLQFHRAVHGDSGDLQ